MTQYCSICGKEIRPGKEAFYVSNNIYSHIDCIYKYQKSCVGISKETTTSGKEK